MASLAHKWFDLIGLVRTLVRDLGFQKVPFYDNKSNLKVTFNVDLVSKRSFFYLK